MRQESGLTALLGQLWRYGISGILVTALGVGVYWVAAVPLRVEPLLANLMGYVAAVVTGYLMHSRWSFRGYGRRDNVMRTTSRFFLVSLVSLAVNSFWVWLLVDLVQASPSWPAVPMLLVTPFLTFYLNRRWVFA